MGLLAVPEYAETALVMRVRRDGRPRMRERSYPGDTRRRVCVGRVARRQRASYSRRGDAAESEPAAGRPKTPPVPYDPASTRAQAFEVPTRVALRMSAGIIGCRAAPVPASSVFAT